MAQDNTIRSFELALSLGATALESDVWLTSDGEAVLDHDGLVRKRMRSIKIRSVASDSLPKHIPTLRSLFERCGTDFELSLDVKDPAAAAEVVAVARQNDPDMVSRLWLCHPSWEVVAGWRSLDSNVKLVDSTRIKRIPEGLEHRLGLLAESGVDALNMHHSDWSAERVALVKRNGLIAFGWDAQRRETLDGLLAMGIDGVFSDHVERMLQALATHQHQ